MRWVASAGVAVAVPILFQGFNICQLERGGIYRIVIVHYDNRS
jgi:hypothetical protein